VNGGDYKYSNIQAKEYSIRDIAQKLQIDKSTINRDLQFIKQQAQDNLQKHIHEIVPEEYQKGMTGLRQNLKHVLEIAETSSDFKIKLEARRIANDCYRYIMDLCTNAGVISDAMKYVTQKAEQVDTLQKLDERIEATGEETTTNGVF
jgi:IS30 family transposase